MISLRPTSLTIHLDRLIGNFNFLQEIAKDQTFICPMIKANAYGHGDVAVAKVLSRSECSHLGVSSVEEGIHLRDHHIDEDVLVFGFHGAAAVRALCEANLTPVVSNFYQLHDLGMQSQNPIRIHLKFDTGMHRLGFQSHEVKAVLQALEKYPHLKVDGVATHFHTGSEITLEESLAWKQNTIFEELTSHFARWNPQFHAYNSAAITALHRGRRRFRFGFRPGLLVYGIDPEENLSLKPLVSPVMEFRSKIVAIQQVKSGEVVSYGGTWQAPRDSLMGIVPAGYADGVCRSLSNKGHFLVMGQKVPIRGRVCMDYTMVDLTDLKTDKDFLNQDVILIGRQGSEQITVEDVAKAANRVTYEVMTGIGERVPRFYGAE